MSDTLQLIIVTAVAVTGLAFIARRFVRTPKPAPAGKTKPAPGCDNCAGH